VRLDIKFRETAPPEARKQVIDEVTRLGATNVAPQFPDESDQELASMYKVEGLADNASDKVLAALNERDEIEYAEPTPSRKLIR
jgi:hypothetical protein